MSPIKQYVTLSDASNPPKSIEIPDLISYSIDKNTVTITVSPTDATLKSTKQPNCFWDFVHQLGAYQSTITTNPKSKRYTLNLRVSDTDWWINHLTLIDVKTDCHLDSKTQSVALVFRSTK